MVKRKSCISEERSAISALRDAGKSYREIAEALHCSKKKVCDALHHVNRHKTYSNIPRKSRPRKRSSVVNQKIVNISIADPKKSSTEIKREIETKLNIKMSSRTIARRLVEAGLHGRIARKKPHLTTVQKIRRVAFAKEHWTWTDTEWKRVLWSDETKVNRLGQDGKRHIRRPKNRAFDPRYISQTMKHGGGSIMVWGCFSWNGVGPIHKINGILTKEQYVEIMDKVMLPWAEENMPVTWKFQQDNDPKHTAKVTKKFFEEKSVDILEWPSSSPDLNPIEHL